MSACLNSALLISQLAQSRHTGKNHCFLLTLTVLRAQTCRAGGSSQAVFVSCAVRAEMRIKTWLERSAEFCCSLSCWENITALHGQKSSSPAYFCLGLCYCVFLSQFVSFSVKAVKPSFMDYCFIPWSIPDCSHSPRYLLGYHTQFSLAFLPVSDFSFDNILHLYNIINYFGFLLTLKRSKKHGYLTISEKKGDQFLILSPIFMQPLPAKILSN